MAAILTSHPEPPAPKTRRTQVFSSKKAPLGVALTLESHTENPSPMMVIYKEDDDLRQDILTLQVGMDWDAGRHGLGRMHSVANLVRQNRRVIGLKRL